MIKGIIFDLDGTLIDSDPYWKETDLLMAKKYSFTPTDEFRTQLSGLGIKESAELFIKTYNLKETVEGFMAQRMKYLDEILLNNLHLMPYARELIMKLKNKGAILALATAGHSEDIAIKILNKLALLDYFSFVVSGLEVKHSKPAPDIYIYVANKMGLSPKECVVIEDTVIGVSSGKAAGMKVICVNSNDEIRNRLKNVNADYVFRDLNIPDQVLDNILFLPMSDL